MTDVKKYNYCPKDAHGVTGAVQQGECKEDLLGLAKWRKKFILMKS